MKGKPIMNIKKKKIILLYAQSNKITIRLSCKIEENGKINNCERKNYDSRISNEGDRKYDQLYKITISILLISSS